MINWTDPKNLKDIPEVAEPELYQWLKEILKVTEATITFTKADGSERVMLCTLEPSKLPPIVVKEDIKPRKESTKALRVFDLEKQEWRSFTIKNVKHIQLSIAPKE